MIDLIDLPQILAIVATVATKSPESLSGVRSKRIKAFMNSTAGSVPFYFQYSSHEDGFLKIYDTLKICVGHGAHSS